MGSRTNKKISITRNNLTATLLSMALLVLMVSCPFKQLQQNHTGFTSTVEQSSKQHRQENKAASYKSNCCSLKHAAKMTKPVISKSEHTSPVLIATANAETGFALHYFLSGTDHQSLRSASASLSSYPLYLQHRRLLL